MMAWHWEKIFGIAAGLMIVEFVANHSQRIGTFRKGYQMIKRDFVCGGERNDQSSTHVRPG